MFKNPFHSLMFSYSYPSWPRHLGWPWMRPCANCVRLKAGSPSSRGICTVSRLRDCGVVWSWTEFDMQLHWYMPWNAGDCCIWFFANIVGLNDHWQNICQNIFLENARVGITRSKVMLRSNLVSVARLSAWHRVSSYRFGPVLAQVRGIERQRCWNNCQINCTLAEFP